jgi:branched-chain amino acid transport system ATP-binding protein
VNGAVLELNDVHVHYGHIHALKGVSLRVEAGETVVLIGGNGAGKSTTLRTISALIRPSQGDVVLEGERTNLWASHALVKHGVIHVPEGRQVFPQLTVAENLDLGGYMCRDANEMRRRLDRVMTIFPVLAQRRKQPAGTLSGGEQQMLAIGRGLMAEPRLLMLDEPSLGLAPAIVDQIFDVLLDLNEQGTTLLLVEQNANVALSIAHRGYVLETGRIVMEGPAETLLEDEGVRRAYLGY